MEGDLEGTLRALVGKSLSATRRVAAGSEGATDEEIAGLLVDVYQNGAELFLHVRRVPTDFMGPKDFLLRASALVQLEWIQ